MPRALIQTFGGKAISGGALAPRSRRGVQGQVDDVRRGNNITLAAAPTGLSVTSKSSSSVTISFTAPTDLGGGTLLNYAYSTNGTTFTQLSPADTTSPVTITGLTLGSSYTLYLAAVNESGVGASSSGVAASLTTDATGGTVTTYTSGGFTYKSHLFASTGTFSVTSVLSDINADIWIVSGGGGAGVDRGGGGGAGGAKTVTGIPLSATNYTMTVGGSGAIGNAGSRGGNGGNSSGLGYSTSGGGAGSANNYAGASGGSGGGQASGIAGEGNAGGSPNSDDGAGGGGKGSAGAAGVPAGSGDGGNAGTNDYQDGTSRSYSAGGAGTLTSSGTKASEYGRGGKGNTNSGIQAGVVIVRYRTA